MSTLSPGLPLNLPLNSIHADRKRGRRGRRQGRKHRGGVRKRQRKTDRLRKKHLLIGYWNCRSTKQRGGVLDRLVYDFDVMFLQETKSSKYTCPGYDAYQNPVSDTHHGQTVLVKKNITHRVLDASEYNREDREVQFVEVTISGRKWLLVNVYIGNESHTEVNNWEFLDEMGKMYERVIVMGDFNARSSTWGNEKENEQGKALDLALDEGMFTNMNFTVMTRMAQREDERDSNIDLCLVKTGAEAPVSWRALTDHGSDHLPCSVQILASGKAKKTKIRRPFAYKKSSIPALDKIRKKAWTPKSHRPNFSKPPYWNEDLEQLWLNKRKAIKCWQKVKKNANISEEEKRELKENMRKQTQAFKEQAEEARKAKWEAFAKEVSSEKALQKFWKLHKSMNKARRDSTIVGLVDEQGNRLTTDEARGSAFLERYIEQTHQHNIQQRKETRDIMDEAVPDTTYVNKVTKEEVEIALKSTKDTAAGPDGVRYSHIKAAEEADLDELIEAFNDSLESGTIPDEWLHSYLMPLPKPGKDHTKLNGYRIITMQNTVGKVLEKVIARRVMQHLENNNLLPDGLGSYRPGRDTCVNTATLAYDIYEGFQQKEETVIAAIDLEDAYNRVDYDKLMDSLLDLNIDPWIMRWIAEALMSRKVALRSGVWVSDVKEISPGLPQGSALSPVLFNVYTAKIASTGTHDTGRVLSFADDVTAYERGSDRLETVKCLQGKLDTLAKWCSDYSAVINPSKAQVLWCSLDNRIVEDPTPPITFDYEVIERESELKYLGITFDRTLSFKKHVDNVAVRAKKGVSAIKTMASAKVEQHVLFLMLQLVVLSVIDYGLGCLTLSESQIQRLDRLQNAAMRAVLGCTKDTHIVCMRYLLDLPSIKVRHRLAQVKMYLKVAENETHPLHEEIKADKGNRLKRGKSWMAEAEDSLKKVCNLEEIKTGKEWVELEMEGRKLTKVIITMGREQREVADVVTEQEIQALINDNSRLGDLVVYTDGSVQRGVKSGWGFIITQDGKITHKASGAVASTASSMKMEIVAITRALELIVKSQQAIDHLVFLTDSQSTLRKIERNMLRKEWLELIQGTSVREIVWIFCPGHSGVQGNVAADRLAGEAVVGDSIELDRGEILNMLTDTLREEEDRSVEDHHAISRMRALGVKKGEGRTSRLTGTERNMKNQKATGTVSMKTLRVTLERGAEHLWTCPQCNDAVAPTKV